jgi:cycloeucalenol cycloisomerase
MARGYWFSKNPDKAWAEKFLLIFIPVFFIYNGVIQALGWLDVGNFWHIVQNLAMWVPYCLLLPLWLRRNSGVPWQRSYWFKFNLYLAVYVFFATYYHTEYFFDVLGIRYHFPQVTLYLDSFLLGPDEATALAQHKKIPLGMYLNAIAFFVVYHNAAVVCMRRIKTMTLGFAPLARRLAWAVIVASTALFFAWAETFFYITSSAVNNVWYEDLDAMLRVGSVCYALYFIVSFPNIYRMDEEGDSWTLSRCVIEAGFVSMLSLFLLDLFAWLHGPIV